jgi:DNA-binding protein HU-beta
MNRAELVNSISEKTNLPKKDVDSMVTAFTETVTETLCSGDSIVLIGFGTFSVRQRSARVGRNPKTGEEIQIGDSKSAGFKQGKGLKGKLN